VAGLFGHDRQTGEPVAIKELMSDWVARAPDSVERFRREGEALRKLNHPNIVKMLATLEENDQHYLVMDTSAAVRWPTYSSGNRSCRSSA